MKKTILLSTLLTLQSSLAISAPLLETPQKSSHPVPFRMPQAEEVQSESVKQLIGNQPFQEVSTSLAEKVINKFDGLMKDAENEIDKLKIDLKIQLLNFSTTGSYYQYTVEQAFVNGQHARQDIWVIELKTPWNGLQVGSQVRFTFNRLFPTKLEAMKAKPYFPISIEKLGIKGKYPWSSDDVSRLLKTGDVARFEIFGSAGVGVSNSHGFFSNGTTSVKASYAREALFLMDIYKHNSSTVRSRFLALKNKGHLSLGASIGLKPGLDIPFIDKIIGLKASLNFDKSSVDILDPKAEYPIDSMMLDYVYSFGNQSLPKEERAETAFDDVLKNITQLGFADIFDPRVTDDELKNVLLTKVALSDNIFKQDYIHWQQGQTRAEDIRVRRLFKGRVMSTATAVTGKVRAGQMTKVDGQSSTTRSFVISNDMNEKQSYYILDGSESRFSTSYVYGRVSKLKKISVDLLMEANGDTRMPVRPLDLIVNKQYKDKSMDAKELAKINDYLIRNLPENLKADPEVANFFPKTDQRNASLNYRFNYGPAFYQLLSKIDTGTLIQKLTKFIEEYPNKHELTLPKENPETIPVLNGTLAEYIVDLARQLKKIASNSQVETEKAVLERLNAFRDMKDDPNFERFIITEFFATLAAESDSPEVKNEFGLTLTFSGKETPTKIKHFGTFNSSEIYNAVSFFRSAVNDRSFDLRLETVEAQTKNGLRKIEIPLNFSIPSED